LWRQINATSKILITDSCHSGAISPEDTQKVNRRSHAEQSLFSLTASRDREQSFESADLGVGTALTYYVSKHGGEADTSKDGW